MAETDLLDFLAYQTHPEVLRYMPIEPLTEEQAMRFLARQAVVEIGDEGGYIAFAVHHVGDAKRPVTSGSTTTARILLIKKLLINLIITTNYFADSISIRLPPGSRT
jgi:hypothetical protein